MRPVLLVLPESGRGALTITILTLAVALACPIQRPPVPREYYDFRAELEAAVADTAVAEMEGDSAMQDRLEDSLADLAAIVTTDSLIVRLDSDPFLWPLGSAVAAVLHRKLESEHVGGRVRSAYDNPDGQRLAVDGIIIGFGKALRRLKGTSGRGSGDQSFVSPRNASTSMPRVANTR